MAVEYRETIIPERNGNDFELQRGRKGYERMQERERWWRREKEGVTEDTKERGRALRH